MHILIKKSVYLAALIGLLFIQQVPAIDGDYSNPYSNDPGAAQTGGAGIWNGKVSYGGRDKKLPVMTGIGSGLLLMGIITVGYCKRRENRRKIAA